MTQGAQRLGHEATRPRKRTSVSPTPSGPSSSGRSPGSHRPGAGSSKRPAPSETRSTRRRRQAAELDEDDAETRPAAREPSLFADLRREPRRRPALPTRVRPRTVPRRALRGIPRTRRAALHRRIAAAEERAPAGTGRRDRRGAGTPLRARGRGRPGDPPLSEPARRAATERLPGGAAPLRARARARRGSRTMRPCRAELELRIGLGAATMATAGSGPHVEAAYSRARELSQRIGDTPGQFPRCSGCGSSTGVAARCEPPTASRRAARQSDATPICDSRPPTRRGRPPSRGAHRGGASTLPDGGDPVRPG